MSESNSVVVEKFIKADPKRVHRALTESVEMERWFFTDATTDPRPGGNYKIRWRSEKEPARDHDRFGRYLRFVAHELVEFEWRGTIKGGAETLPDTVVTITLAPQPGGTLVRLVHAGWPDSAEGRGLCESHRGGWNFYITNLAAYIEGGADRRREHFGQRINE